MVISGSGEILGGRWCGRMQCRFVGVAFPMLVKDVALAAFLSRLGSGVAAARCPGNAMVKTGKFGKPTSSGPHV